MNDIDALIRRIERLGSAAVRRVVAESIEPVMQSLAQGSFGQRSDPYGSRWQDRKQPTGAWPLLNKSDRPGHSITSLKTTAQRTSVRSRIVGYFKFHQSGTRYMPARRVFPDPSRGLGAWAEPIRSAVVAALRSLL